MSVTEYFIILTSRLLLLPIFANVGDLFGKPFRFHTGPSMNIRHASSLLPLSLSDEQMQVVMLAVASLPTEKRICFFGVSHRCCVSEAAVDRATPT